jgi:uncharacterized membrane protein YheB (UPF0754 family)
MIVVKFKWCNRQKFVELKCSILDQETHETIPKCLDNLSDVNMTSSRKRNYNDEEHDDDNEEIRNVGRRLPTIESNEHEESNATNENNSLVPELSNSLSLSEKEDLKEMSVDEIIKLAKNKEFPKKLFIFDRAKVFYTPRLHFWTSKRIFDQRPTQPIKFVCKICDSSLSAKVPNFQNLNAHLKPHEKFQNWLKEFNKVRPRSNGSMLDDATYDLIRYIISSNTALAQLENVHFQKLLESKMNVPCIRTFRDSKLPQVYQQLLDAINKKLDEALSICLISDIWTNKIMADFIALAVFIVNKFKEREFMVIGMMGMPGNHTSENVQKSSGIINKSLQLQ